MKPFSFFKVGFKSRIVRVSFAFYLDVAFNGGAVGVVQPYSVQLSFIITGFAKEAPIAGPTLLKVFLFEPDRSDRRQTCLVRF
jgi:hypothetical protein